ncbi:MAG: type II toxin-antitoxin system RelE/ParE family toxin [Acidobacteriaceae bacterium]
MPHTGTTQRRPRCRRARRRPHRTSQGRLSLDVYRVVFDRNSRRDLRDIRRYIARESSPRIARQYIDRLTAFAHGLSLAPHRGERRTGLQPEFRTIGFKGRVSILFAVSDEEKLVRVVGFRYAGHGWQHLADDEN